MSATAWLGVLLTVVVLQRLGELRLSARNARRVLARGGREYGAGHFPLLVVLHAIFPLALAGEVLALGARPGRLWPLWLGLWIGAQVLRYAAVRALGERWNVRIYVIPGVARVRSGVYRFMRHPNYLAVVIELLAAPMIFGAWRTALAASALNAIALTVRIRAEEDALRRAGGPARTESSRRP
jgi:methyltransferase